MNRLLVVFLLALPVPAQGAGQALAAPRPDVGPPDLRMHVERVQAPAHERRPFEALLLPDRGAQIGVTIRDIDPADVDSQKAAGGSGVVVEQVRPGSPAGAAGMRAADLVVAFDGERVRSSRQFSRLVQETPPGRTVSVTIVRDGRRSEVSITPAPPQAAGGRDGRAGRDANGNIVINPDVLRERLERDLGRLDLREVNVEIPGASARGRLGIGVDDLTPQLASYFGVKDGVLVTTVIEDRPAARGGLRAGDVIVTLNGEAVRNRTELQRAVGRAQVDAEVTIGLVRDRKAADVKVKLD